MRDDRVPVSDTTLCAHAKIHDRTAADQSARCAEIVALKLSECRALSSSYF